jgi:sugar lactone lactonase YvrE
LKTDVVVGHKCLLGEGPVWDVNRKAILWVDILNGEIHEYATVGKSLQTIRLGEMIGSFALCKSGNFVGALKNGFAFINRETGERKMLGNPEAHLVNNRFNDGKCDPNGRFFAGTMSLSEEHGAGSVYVIDKHLNVEKIIHPVSISNGMAWSLDHRKFYYIDTPTFEVLSYDYDKITGRISSKGVVIKVAREDGFPDGMTIDSEGMLWIAHWDGWQVTRWNPLTGEKLQSVTLPAARITSCTFGGEHMQDLYITSARIGLSEEQLMQQPLAGSLFVIRDSGFSGMQPFEFEDE